MSKITPSQTLNTVLTQTNAGTAGGTMNYINLGGIKMLWITTPNLTTSSGGNQYTITLPTSFFATIQSVSATPCFMTADARQYANLASVSTSSLTITIVSPNAAATSGASILVIGT